MWVVVAAVKLYTAPRGSRSNRLSLSLPSGPVRKEQCLIASGVSAWHPWPLFLSQQWKKHFTSPFLKRCYCSSYLLLLIVFGHRLFFLAQLAVCLSAQLLSFKYLNVCLAQKHQGRLFISKTKDAVWVAFARAEALMPLASLCWLSQCAVVCLTESLKS